MCRRSDGDPLVRLLTDRYRLNILRVPRTGLNVGDLLVEDSGDLHRMGAFSRFFDPPLDMGTPQPESLAPLSGEQSRAISWKAAAQPMAAFLTALGVPGITSLSAEVEAAQDVNVTFQITGATLEALDVVELGNQLAGEKLRKDNALYRPRRRFFIAYAVARATGLALGFHANGDAGVKVAAGIATVAKTSAAVTVKNASAAEIGVTGTTPLVFGLRVLRLTESKKENGALRLDLPKKLHTVRRKDEPGKAEKAPETQAAREVLFGGDKGEFLVAIDETP